MEIIETIDEYFLTVYKIEENGHTIGVMYNRKDAETAKAALEKERIEQSKNSFSDWY